MYDLYLFDKDQTLSSPFPGWARAADQAFHDLAGVRADARTDQDWTHDGAYNYLLRSYNIKREATKDTDQPFKVNTWYWDIEKLIVNIDMLQPQNEQERSLFEEWDARICKTYDKNRKNSVEAFPGIPEVIGELSDIGASMAILSDGRISEIASAMGKVGIEPDKFGAIACQFDEKFSEHPFNYSGKLSQYRGKKPDQSSLDAARDVIQGFGLNKGSIVVIGDNKADAMVADALKNFYEDTDVTVDFAWAKYGAALTPHAVNFNNNLLNDPYRLGVEANEKGIWDFLGKDPDHVLETPQDILKIGPRPR
jgi:phosphoglycolate phosphatase-like HAD superfamily hydrolase